MQFRVNITGQAEPTLVEATEVSQDDRTGAVTFSDAKGVVAVFADFASIVRD